MGDVINGSMKNLFTHTIISPFTKLKFAILYKNTKKGQQIPRSFTLCLDKLFAT